MDKISDVIFYVIYQKLDFPFYSSSAFRFINLKKKKKTQC